MSRTGGTPMLACYISTRALLQVGGKCHSALSTLLHSLAARAHCPACTAGFAAGDDAAER